MSTDAVLSESKAADLLAETSELHRLGYLTGVAATARAAIEVAIVERLGDDGHQATRRPIKDRLRVLDRATDLRSKARDEVRQVFFLLSVSAHGRTFDVEPFPRLLGRAADAVHAIASS